MNFFLTIIVFLIIIGVLVFVHELGHFIAAKLMKVTVYEFAIGFGPKIFEKYYRGTHYKINLLPLGGYVSLEGENESNNPDGFRNKGFAAKLIILSGGVFMNFVLASVLLFFFLGVNNFVFILPKLTDHNYIATSKQMDTVIFQVRGNIEDDGEFNELETGDIIISADDRDFLNANDIYLYISENAGKGIEFKVIDLEDLNEEKIIVKAPDKVNGYDFPIIVNEVLEGGRSQGIFKSGDQILSINDKTFKSPSDFGAVLDEVLNKEVKFSYIDSETGEIISKDVKVGDRNESGAVLDIRYDTFMGIEFSKFSDLDKGEVFLLKYPKSIFSSVALSFDLSVYQYKVLGNLIGEAFDTGDFSEVSESVGGPIAVGDAVGEVVSYRSFTSLIFLTALISLSLAAFNILPIPALDGGQILIAFIESVRRKKFSDDTVNRINTGGFLFLMGFSLLIIFKDIVQFDIFGNIAEIIKKVFGK